jgi:Flp pilus assembly protein TadD
MRGKAAVLVALGLAACGGSSTPPAQTGGAPTGAPTATTDDTSGSSGASAAPERPPSPEVSAGVKAFDANNFAEARTDFEAATKKNPNDYSAFVNLGQTCEKLGDSAAAEAAYKSAIAIKPDLDVPASELAALYVTDGRIDDAFAVCKAGIAKHPGSAPLHASMGIALAAHGDQDPATQEFQQALKLAPADPMMHLNFAHWLNVWHVRGAAPHLDAALGMVQNDLGMLASIGFEYRMAGEFDSCVKTFDRAIKIRDGGEVRTERALCKVGLKDDKGALDDLQGAVAAEASYAPAHYYLGGRLAHAKRFKEAATEYARYLELAPNGSLAQQATAHLTAAQDAAKNDKSAVAPKKK